MNHKAFKDTLEDGRTFSYGDIKITELQFDENGEKPFYFEGGAFEDTNTFAYSDAEQFNGKPITPAILNEIFYSSRVPIKVKVAGVTYIVANGFLAHLKNDDQIIPLVLLNFQNENPSSLYVSRKACINARYISISSLIRDIVWKHKGECLISDSIEHHFGMRLIIPEFKTIGQRKAFLDEIIKDGLEFIQGEE